MLRSKSYYWGLLFASLCFSNLNFYCLQATMAQESQAGFRVLRDVAYKSGELTDYERSRCKLDWYIPVGKKSFPTIVWFHGGGITAGGKAGEHDVALAHRFVAEGIAVASVNYRLSPQAHYPAYVEDAAAAVAYVVKNAPSHGGSREHVFVSGHSAGGYLTAMVGMNPRLLAAHSLTPSEIAGYAPISGQMITHSTVRGERDIPRTQPLIDEAAPAYYASDKTAPFLCVVGSEDLPARAAENFYFVAAMKAAGHSAIEYFEVEGRDHASIAHRVPEADDAVALKILAFIQAHQ